MLFPDAVCSGEKPCRKSPASEITFGSNCIRWIRVVFAEGLAGAGRFAAGAGRHGGPE